MLRLWGFRLWNRWSLCKARINSETKTLREHLGDFHANISTSTNGNHIRDIVGNFGIDIWIARGYNVPDFCMEYNIVNTCLKHHVRKLYTLNVQVINSETKEIYSRYGCHHLRRILANIKVKTIIIETTAEAQEISSQPKRNKTWLRESRW